MPFTWHVFPCAFTIDLKKEIEKFLNGVGPENCSDGDMHVYVPRHRVLKKNTKSLLACTTQEKLRHLRANVRIRHWCYIGPAVERFWWALNPNGPDVKCEAVATDMVDIFKENSLSLHEIAGSMIRLKVHVFSDRHDSIPSENWSYKLAELWNETGSVEKMDVLGREV